MSYQPPPLADHLVRIERTGLLATIVQAGMVDTARTPHDIAHRRAQARGRIAGDPSAYRTAVVAHRLGGHIDDLSARYLSGVIDALIEPGSPAR